MTIASIEIREVTRKDKWCRFARRKPFDTTEKAPFGYIISIPTPKKDIKLEFLKNHVVLRTKEKQGIFFLQVHLTKDEIRNYGINNKPIEFEEKRKKGKKVKKIRRHVLNLCNFNKRQQSQKK